jgi:hypothetical protein
MDKKFLRRSQLTEPIPLPPCNSCVNHIYGYTCKAYDEIPDSIIFRDVTHNKVLEGQKGNFVYERAIN